MQILLYITVCKVIDIVDVVDSDIVDITEYRYCNLLNMFFFLSFYPNNMSPSFRIRNDRTWHSFSKSNNTIRTIRNTWPTKVQPTNRFRSEIQSAKYKSVFSTDNSLKRQIF